MDHVGIEPVLRHCERASESVHGADKPRVGVILGLLPLRVATDCEVPLSVLLLAKAAHFDRDQASQRLTEIFDMDARAPIDVGRVSLVSSATLRSGAANRTLMPVAG